MKIEHMKMFLEVVRRGSINSAAAHLYISQQNLSMIIKKLEQELGTSLLVRQVSGISLTSDGERFYTCASEVINTYEAFLQYDAQPKASQLIKVYTVKGLALFISKIQMALIKEKIHLTIIECGYPELKRRIRERKQGIYFFADIDADIQKICATISHCIVGTDYHAFFFCHKNNADSISLTSISEHQSLPVVLGANENIGENHIISSDIDTYVNMLKEKGLFGSISEKQFKVCFDDPIDSQEWVILKKYPIKQCVNYILSFNLPQNHDSNIIKEKITTSLRQLFSHIEQD